MLTLFRGFCTLRLGAGMDVGHWIVIARWVVGVLGFLGLGPALMSPMMFATEGALKRWSTMLLFVSVVSFPVVCWLAIVFGDAAAARGDSHRGLQIMCAPLVNIGLAATASAWISVVHRGALGGS